MADPAHSRDEADVPDPPTNAPNKRKAVSFGDDSDSPRKKSTVARQTDSSDKPRTKRRRGNSEKSNKSNRALPIARSYAECAEHDKKLIDMRDAGESWPDIRKEWERITGEAAGRSTLPNRYMRLKSNFTVIPDEDKATLIAAKQFVEDKFDTEKWERIAAVMEQKGTQKYVPEVLYIQYKKMMLGAEYLPIARTEAWKKSVWEGRVDGMASEWEDE